MVRSAGGTSSHCGAVGCHPSYGPTDCIITRFVYLSGQCSRRWPCLLCVLLSQRPHGCLEEGCPLLILRRQLWFSSSPDQGRQSGFQEFAGAWGEDGGKNQEGPVSILTRRSSVLLLWQMTPKWTPRLVQVWFPLTQRQLWVCGGALPLHAGTWGPGSSHLPALSSQCEAQAAERAGGRGTGSERLSLELSLLPTACQPGLRSVWPLCSACSPSFPSFPRVRAGVRPGGSPFFPA